MSYTAPVRVLARNSSPCVKNFRHLPDSAKVRMTGILRLDGLGSNKLYVLFRSQFLRLVDDERRLASTCGR